MQVIQTTITVALVCRPREFLGGEIQYVNPQPLCANVNAAGRLHKLLSARFKCSADQFVSVRCVCIIIATTNSSSTKEIAWPKAAHVQRAAY